jgi:hypothetical protein
LQEKMKVDLQEAQEQLMTARVERDRNAYELQQLGHASVAKQHDKENVFQQPGLERPAGQLAEQNADGKEGFIRGYLDRIARLEKEIRRLKEARAIPGP